MNKKYILAAAMLSCSALQANDPIIQVPVAVSSSTTPAVTPTIPTHVKSNTFTGGMISVVLGYSNGALAVGKQQGPYGDASLNGLGFVPGRYQNNLFNVGVSLEYLIQAGGVTFGPAMYFTANPGHTYIRNENALGIDEDLLDPKSPTNADILGSSATSQTSSGSDEAAEGAGDDAGADEEEAVTPAEADVPLNAKGRAMATKMDLRIHNPWTFTVGAKIGIPALTTSSSGFMPFAFAGYSLSKFTFKPALYDLPSDNSRYEVEKYQHKNLSAFTFGFGVKLLMFKHMITELALFYDIYSRAKTVNFNDKVIGGKQDTLLDIRPSNLRCLLSFGVKY